MENTVAISEEEVKRYYILQQEKKEMEHEMKQLKKKFHHFLDESAGKNKRGEIHRGDYCIQRQIRTSIYYTPEITVSKLEEMQLSDFVITEKRPDTEKLEAAIRLGLVNEEDFADCKDTKITQAIVVRTTK